MGCGCGKSSKMKVRSNSMNKPYSQGNATERKLYVSAGTPVSIQKSPSGSVNITKRKTV